MRLETSLTVLALMCAVPSAHAQVLITELQPNVFGGADLGEWIEIQNLGAAPASLAGYTISDSSGGVEILNRYALPATATVAPGQVILIVRQATEFHSIFPGVRATYELADGADDPATPNITRTGMGNILQLSNTGDALYLRDAQGALVSGVEYGTTDSMAIAGAPFPRVPNPENSTPRNASLTRVMTTGNSQVDFTDRFVASPGVGYSVVTGPVISNAASRPRHAVFGARYTITASVTSAEPLQDVSMYFATSTSSVATSSAVKGYAELEPTRTASATYSYSANVEAFAPGHGFGTPATFHDRYLRWYIRAQDAVGASSVEPVGASDSEGNANFRPAYLQNVLPVTPTPIADARLEHARLPGPAWRGHSVRVRGTAIIGPAVMQPNRVQFALVDASNAGITVFDVSLPPDTFSFGPGAVIEVTGTLNDFRGLTQIGQNAEIVVTNEVAPVPTTTVTIADLIGPSPLGGNRYESQLVTIRDVNFVDARASWPSEPNNTGSWNVPVTDGTGRLTLRVTAGAVGLFAEPAPQFGFDVTGVVGQFETTWQVFPRSAADVIAKAAPPPEDGGVRPDAAPGADASSAGRDASTGSRSDASTDPVPQPEPDSGCSCASAAPGGAVSLDLVLGLAVVLGMAIRRRRRAS